MSGIVGVRHDERRGGERRRGAILGACILGIAAVVSGTASGQSSTNIVRVEEDWELVVNIPEPGLTAPQVSCAMSTLADLSGHYMVFELNHHSQPSFEAGGIQLQSWYDDEPLLTKDNPVSGLLGHEEETVRWTQQMRLDGCHLVFEATNGTSQTWGNFGGQGYLRAAVETSLTSLNGYSPEASKRNSGVSYAGNRVRSLRLMAVRLYSQQGLVAESTTPAVIHESGNE